MHVLKSIISLIKNALCSLMQSHVIYDVMLRVWTAVGLNMS